MRYRLPVIGFVGSSGSGKTTLLEKVIGHLAEVRVRVAALKYAGPGFDLDQDPSKDSHRLRSSGADQVLIASRDRWALMGQQADPLREPSLDEMIGHLDASALDAVLVEGFQHEDYPKIEVYRPSRGRSPQCWPDDSSVIAVASDARLETAPATWLDLSDSLSVARFVARQLGFAQRKDSTMSGIVPGRVVLWP